MGLGGAVGSGAAGLRGSRGDDGLGCAGDICPLWKVMSAVWMGQWTVARGDDRLQGVESDDGGVLKKSRW